MKNYEEIIEKLLARITELETLAVKQALETAELRRGLNKNSSNSSQYRVALEPQKALNILLEFVDLSVPLENRNGISLSPSMLHSHIA